MDREQEGYTTGGGQGFGKVRQGQVRRKIVSTACVERAAILRLAHFEGVLRTVEIPPWCTSPLPPPLAGLNRQVVAPTPFD